MGWAFGYLDVVLRQNYEDRGVKEIQAQRRQMNDLFICGSLSQGR